MSTGEVLEGSLEVDEIVMAVVAMLGTKEGDFERPESDGAGVVACVEALREEKTEASIVSESLSPATESVEEAEEDGKDWSPSGVAERIGLEAESGV